jgi:outer membrane protein assembly factor BamA
MKAFFRILILLLLASLGLPAPGQSSGSEKPLAKMSASAQRLTAITVTGSQHFPEPAVAAATGLQIGGAISEDDFKKAVRTLADTGAFADIQYTYSYSSAGTKLELHVTDADKFVPAHFEDFVWFSDAELLRRIQQQVPLFQGSLPLSGRMADEVSDALQTMLVENAIPGHVDYVRSSQRDGPVESIDYKVSDVLVRIRNIEFTGAGEKELPALQAAAEKMPDREYSRSRLDLLVERQLLPIFHAHGYLKAAFGDPQPHAVTQPSADNMVEGIHNQTVVDVTYTVTPGRQYTLKSLAWSGNHAIPTEALETLVRAPIGEPANTVRLTDSLKSVQQLYGSRGYITAAIKVNADFDDESSAVRLGLMVSEGPIYRMGDLEFRGLDNALTAKLRNAWKLRQGDVYDSTYLNEYLPAAQKLLPASLDWDVSSHVTANIRDKTVDVDLIYSAKAPK